MKAIALTKFALSEAPERIAYACSLGIVLEFGLSFWTILTSGMALILSIVLSYYATKATLIKLVQASNYNIPEDVIERAWVAALLVVIFRFLHIRAFLATLKRLRRTPQDTTGQRATSLKLLSIFRCFLSAQRQEELDLAVNDLHEDILELRSKGTPEASIRDFARSQTLRTICAHLLNFLSQSFEKISPVASVEKYFRKK